jgi:hypothetical protein
MPEYTRDEIELGAVAGQLISTFDAMRQEIYALRGEVQEQTKELRQLRAQHRRLIQALRVEPALLEAPGSGD